MSILNSPTEVSMPRTTARPRKAAPLHPGEVIGDTLADHVSVRSAAASLGFSHTLLQKIIDGDRSVTAPVAMRLATYLGQGLPGAKLWLDLQRDYDLHQAQLELERELKAIKPLKIEKARG